MTRIVVEGQLSLRDRPMDGEDVIFDEEEISFEFLLKESGADITSLVYPDDLGYRREHYGRWRLILERVE